MVSGGYRLRTEKEPGWESPGNHFEISRGDATGPGGLKGGFVTSLSWGGSSSSVLQREAGGGFKTLGHRPRRGPVVESSQGQPTSRVGAGAGRRWRCGAVIRGEEKGNISMMYRWAFATVPGRS